jgi:hypothetical protein
VHAKSRGTGIYGSDQEMRTDPDVVVQASAEGQKAFEGFFRRNLCGLPFGTRSASATDNAVN